MDYETLSHSKWDCKCHVVFIPKYRREALCAELRRQLGAAFKTLAEQKESRIEEGHLMADHVHMLISIPPKYAVAHVVGFIKGKSAIHLARTFMDRKTRVARSTNSFASLSDVPSRIGEHSGSRMNHGHVASLSTEAAGCIQTQAD